MIISSIHELESLELLDLDFKLKSYRESQVPTTKGPIFQAVTTHRLEVIATFKWSSRSKRTLSYKLTDDIAKYLSDNWPDTTQRLQIILALAGGVDIWQDLERVILCEYERFGEHGGVPVDVRC